MRKWAMVALALALVLPLGAGRSEDAAEAPGVARPEWREGMSAAKPYAGVPEVDLNERLGYMIFYPTQASPAENSCDRLYVYLPREDVKAGKGKIYLCTEEDDAVWSARMDDAAWIEAHRLTAAECASLIWGGGTCFEIALPRSLELGKRYFVNMERGCIVTEDGALDSPEVGGTDMWSFALTGAYGVGGVAYFRDGGEPVAHPEAGDEIRFELTLGGEAAMAALYGYNGSVDFLTAVCGESGEVAGTVLAEHPAWGVMFLDGEGNELNRCEFYR